MILLDTQGENWLETLTDSQYFFDTRPTLVLGG